MTELDPLIDELVVAGSDDWVDAAEVAWIAKSMGPPESSEAIRDLSVRLIGKVLGDGLMRIGEVTVTDRGFAAWEVSIDEAVERVDREWRALDREPDLGDVFWLENTLRGEQLAAEVLRRRHGADDLRP